MNKTLIIYDNEGYVISQITGFYRVPVGIPFIEVDEIPSNKILTGVNVETKELILEDRPKTENEILYGKVDKLEEETLLTNETVVDVDFRLTMIELGLN